ncbi:MAG TPA: methionine--tRNA ligase, partial [Candidatus Latescibacteria bacterium]|nr:methionine--tRNA ligase [Candidatus Latescibacterota bacterium]
MPTSTPYVIVPEEVNKVLKKILVCSAWPYASNVPHLGNLISSLLSGDVFARYYKLRGHEVLYVSGSDTHGTHIEYEAFKQAISPKELSTRIHNEILKILEGFEIDMFYTTTESPTHYRFIRDIYLKMEANSYIFSREEERAFCRNCQKFLADRFIQGTCPHCGSPKAYGNQCDDCGTLLEPEDLLEPRCRICGQSRIVFKRTRNWYLDLPKLESELKAFVTSRAFSGNVQKFTENLLAEGLQPRAVTRDLVWGIPAPFAGADGKVLYVWAENALGYVSATIEYFEKQGDPDGWKDFWFSDDVFQIYTQGKDNIPFHTIFFPAQLLASQEGYHLPDQISATEYLNWIGGEQFSKTRGIGIYCDDALQLLPGLYWRFYLLYARPEKKDVDFSWEELGTTVNGVLIDNISNLVNRVIALANRLYDGQVEADPEGRVLEQVQKTKDQVEREIEGGALAPALRRIAELAVFGNHYFQEE